MGVPVALKSVVSVWERVDLYAGELCLYADLAGQGDVSESDDPGSVFVAHLYRKRGNGRGGVGAAVHSCDGYGLYDEYGDLYRPDPAFSCGADRGGIPKKGGARFSDRGLSYAKRFLWAFVSVLKVTPKGRERRRDMGGLLETILTVYKDYGGGSMTTVFVLAALLYLWLTEEKKEIRLTLVYLTAAALALFFFPLFAYVAMRVFLEPGVYYRILWLVPMGLVTAYAGARILSMIETGRRRLLAGLLIALLLVRGGSLIYKNPMVTKAENPYHLPEAVLSVADVMHVEGRDVKAVVPAELLQFIRQYDASILLAYGRDALVQGWNNNPLYEAMEASPVRSFAVTDYAKQQGVEYIVLRTGTPIVGTKPIDEYEFSYLTTADNYDIYIFDRAEFAQEKKAEYESLTDPGREDFYTHTN